MNEDLDPEGVRLPIKLDSTSNGEFRPIPLDRTLIRANEIAQASADRCSRRLGVRRRAFLTSACGAAATLLAFNRAHAAAGRTGGFFDLWPEAALEPAAAAEKLRKSEFIFDVQGHFVNPSGAWLKGFPPEAMPLADLDKAKCRTPSPSGERTYLQCLGPSEFIKDVFLDSDTDMMVLSFVPSTRKGEPLTIEEAAATREIVSQMKGSKRLFLHGRVNPNQADDIEDMDRLAEFGLSAFKTYTQWGPRGTGFWLTDDVGLRFIEKARRLGIRNICIHKGLPFGRDSYEHSTCRDIGPAAKLFPDMNFLVYHSGYVAGEAEGPYDPQRSDGIDSLISSVLAAGVAPNSNVYADLGSTWRFLSMRDPTSAAHALGKLFKFIGENNVLWGTDSIWYGSPQDQIQSFRTFQISDELQERHGYPAMTPTLRSKVFGKNATRVYDVEVGAAAGQPACDAIARAKAEYEARPNPAFRTYGPRTRREFAHLRSLTGGEP